RLRRTVPFPQVRPRRVEGRGVVGIPGDVGTRGLTRQNTPAMREGVGCTLRDGIGNTAGQPPVARPVRPPPVPADSAPEPRRRHQPEPAMPFQPATMHFAQPADLPEHRYSRRPCTLPRRSSPLGYRSTGPSRTHPPPAPPATAAPDSPPTLLPPRRRPPPAGRSQRDPAPPCPRPAPAGQPPQSRRNTGVGRSRRGVVKGSDKEGSQGGVPRRPRGAAPERKSHQSQQPQICSLAPGSTGGCHRRPMGGGSNRPPLPDRRRRP
ncbi:hypothetical protein SAMN05216499_1481, partial [Actinacidiphila paucisporea]